MAPPAAAPAPERYTVVSADGHAGADIGDYRPYLASRWHDEFDAWASAYVNPYADLRADRLPQLGQRPAPGRDRGRWHRGRGAVPQHGPTVLQ